jgi:hypothetical protein
VGDYIPDDVVDDHFNFLIFIIYFILICNFLLSILYSNLKSIKLTPITKAKSNTILKE